jgi:predicted NUDIX family NTP pyrophosphohydrolase
MSAGLLMYRRNRGQLEVLLAHPGGPFFAKKDAGHWTIPKGEIEPGEGGLTAALREFHEEVGVAVDPKSRFLLLGSIRQKGGKIVHAWACEGNYDEAAPVQSSTFEMEWPPSSGKRQRFPEVDQLKFFPLPEARRKIKDTQIPLLDRLEELLAAA